MADKLNREETFIDALALTLQYSAGKHRVTSWAEIQAVVTTMRTLGYLQEVEYSKMMTMIVQRSGERTVRSDGSETIDLARTVEVVQGRDHFRVAHDDADRLRMPHDEEDVLPSEP